jgi:hypothetical protein
MCTDGTQTHLLVGWLLQMWMSVRRSPVTVSTIARTQRAVLRAHAGKDTRFTVTGEVVRVSDHPTTGE